jgi:hypothetical protein
MRSVRFVCLFAILISMLVLAQSSRNQLANQSSGLPNAQQRHPLLPPNLSQMPQGAPFALHGAGALKVTGARRGASPMQGGLDFANAVAYGSGGYYPYSAAVADVNGDGKPDVLVVNSCFSNSNCMNGTVGVLLGNGDGTFQAAVTYGSGGNSPESVAVADVNGDGKPDVLVVNSDTVAVLLGNGDGTFQTAATYPGGGGFLAVQDVNGDNKPDLLVTNMVSSVGVLLGNGDGTFQPIVYYASGGVQSMGVAVADVNGDGKPDLLVANLCDPTGHCSDATLGVLLGNGDGTFEPVVTYLCGGSCTSVAVADVNGDGKLDLLVAEYSGPLGVLLGNGDGTFQPVVTYSFCRGTWGNSLAVADVNGDGKLDLLLACYTSAGVLLGNGDGTFQPIINFASGGTSTFSVAVADVNGDSKPDLVMAN